jgi:hypothetical protein
MRLDFPYNRQQVTVVLALPLFVVASIRNLGWSEVIFLAF